jgi:hypothetical protein
VACDKVKVEIKSKPEVKCRLIGQDLNKNCIDVGTVLYGQTRDFVVEYPLVKGKEIEFSAIMSYHGGKSEKSINGLKADNPANLFAQFCRSGFCEYTIQGLNKYIAGTKDNAFLTGMIKFYKTAPCKDEETVKALLRDLESANEMEGRVSKAFSTPERIQRWGAHYVRSIIRAHQLQQCHNFKDPGVQVYGGKMFKDLQKKADVIFCSLPPPTANVKHQADPSSPAQAAPASMASFNDCSGGCFSGEGLVQLANGTQKRVKELQKGDEIVDSLGSKAKIVCLIAYKVMKWIQVCEINGLLITPKHPIKNSGEWVYPQEIKCPHPVFLYFVYNVVLTKITL